MLAELGHLGLHHHHAVGLVGIALVILLMLALGDLEAASGRIEADLRHLGVSTVARAHVRVSGVLQVSAHIAGFDRLHALQLVKNRLQAPEAAAAQRGNFLSALWLRHVTHLSRTILVWRDARNLNIIPYLFLPLPR